MHGVPCSRSLILPTLLLPVSRSLALNHALCVSVILCLPFGSIPPSLSRSPFLPLSLSLTLSHSPSPSLSHTHSVVLSPSLSCPPSLPLSHTHTRPPSMSQPLPLPPPLPLTHSCPPHSDASLTFSLALLSLSPSSCRLLPLAPVPPMQPNCKSQPHPINSKITHGTQNRVSYM
jgi:hypothetical protein